MSNDCSAWCACALHSAGFSGKFHAISCGSMRPHRQSFSHQIQHACATVQYFIDTSLKDCCYSDTRDNYFLPQSFCSEIFSPPSTAWLQPFLWRIVLHKSASGILNQLRHRECSFVCSVCVTDYYYKSGHKTQADGAPMWQILLLE